MKTFLAAPNKAAINACFISVCEEKKSQAMGQSKVNNKN